LKYRDRLATRYVIEVAVEPDKWQRVAASDDRLPHTPGIDDAPAARLIGLTGESLAHARDTLAQMQALRRRLEPLARIPATAYIGTLAQPGPIHRLYRGV
jgi:hypothetical protein